MNKNIKKFGILAALGVGAYFLFSSFKSSEKPVTFGPEKPFTDTNIFRKGYTKLETQAYDRSTSKKGALVPKGSVFNVTGTATSSIGDMYITTYGYMLKSNIVLRIMGNDTSRDIIIPTDPIQTK